MNNIKLERVLDGQIKALPIVNISQFDNLKANDMDKIFINKGDHVKKGDIIGTVGSSGRSTGPHLDVRLNWFGIRLDPATILDIK